MTLSEKAAYFKGLVEGLSADRDSREGKLWLSLTEIISDISAEITDLKDTSDDFADALDEVTEELSYLEEITCDLDTPEDYAPELYDDYDDECSGDCESCGLCDYDDEDEADEAGEEKKTVSFSDVLEKADSFSQSFSPRRDSEGFISYVNDEADEEPELSGELADDEAEDEFDYDGNIYDVTCPVCDQQISFGEDTLAEGFIVCPGCGEKLEFDLSEEE